MAALIMCSIFAGVKIANTVDANGVAMNPTELTTVDPTPADQTFLYEVLINTTVADVSAWEVACLWNPKYLRTNGIVWGNFMTTGGLVDIRNSSVIAGSSEFIIFGQNYEDQKNGTTGAGTLAWINFTWVLPGQTFVKVVRASVWNDDMVETVMPCYDGRVKSNLPAPYFTWSTADGRNPLPTHTVYDGGDSLSNADIVTFNASKSYDVGDTTWNATKGDYDLPVNPDIATYLWEFGDGYAGSDIRLDPTLVPYAYFSYVKTGDLDFGWPLISFLANETYWDADASGSYTIGDSIARWISGNTTTSAGVVSKRFNSSIDTKIYGPVIANWTILKAFTASERHTDGYALQYVATYNAPLNNSIYDASEYVYYDQYYADPGYGTVSSGNTAVITHTYAAYNYNGWTVNLTVWDSEGDFWASTWTSFPNPLNTVPMWRDVGIVDIWPSVPPYQNWEEYADDWYQYWFFDSTDFWLPGPNDPYWDYELPDSLCGDYGIPIGSTVNDIGEHIYILVTANNYGSVAEKINVNLYAIGVQTKIKKTPAGTPNQIISVEQIGSWKNKVLNKYTGSGWSYLTVWQPLKNMTYVLMATIEAASDSAIHDVNLGDNYFYLTSPVSNIAIWNGTSLSMVPHTVTWGEYFADQNGDGKVDYNDLGYITGNNYGLKNLSPSWKNLLPKPPA
jgi:hypothetical protein